MKRLIPTDHADKRLWKRQISLTEAEYVRNHSDLEWAGREGATVFVGTIPETGRRIKIVVMPIDEDNESLITVAGPDESDE